MVALNVFKYYKMQGPGYMDEIYSRADQGNISTRNSYQRLKIPKRKTTIRLKTLSYVGPSFWNKLPSFLKHAQTLNNFKHKMKEYFSTKFKMKENQSFLVIFTCAFFFIDVFCKVCMYFLCSHVSRLSLYTYSVKCT